MKAKVLVVPSILVIYIDNKDLLVDRELEFKVGRESVKMDLRGVIYGGNSHFTSRLLDKSGNLWYNDGMTTGRRCMSDGPILAMRDARQLTMCRGKIAVAAVYSLAGV
jgi:hypothetical protein